MISAIFAAACFFVWFSLALVGGIYDLQGVGGPFNTIVQFQIFREAQVDLLFLSLKFPVPNTEWLKALGNFALLNSSLFEGWANYIRIGLPLALMFGFIFGIIITLFSAILSRR